MNNKQYPAWWNDTITIYNKFEDPLTNLITWYRHTIEGCFVKNANNVVTVGNVTLQTNNVIVRIREDENYRNYRTWITIPNDLRGDYFTLAPNDFIVFDEVTDTIDEYTRNERSNDVLSKYQKLGIAMLIDTFQENIGDERVNPHYFVSGE